MRLKKMQYKRVRILETVVTLIHDNIANAILIIIAAGIFNIPLGTSIKLWILGQSLNSIFSYTRRYLFSKYDLALNRILRCN